jgi:hypothetical protein
MQEQLLCASKDEPEAAITDLSANRRSMDDESRNWEVVLAGMGDEFRSEFRKTSPTPSRPECPFWFSTKSGLPAAAAPPWTVRPFILWGYRDISSWRQCFRSLFYLHNESGNVWTHLIGLIVFTFLLIQEITRTDKPVQHVLIACGYLFATIFCMASSAFFHLAAPHSMLAYERALRIDMTGIALVIIASFL